MISGFEAEIAVEDKLRVIGDAGFLQGRAVSLQALLSRIAVIGTGDAADARMPHAEKMLRCEISGGELVDTDRIAVVFWLVAVHEDQRNVVDFCDLPNHLAQPRVLAAAGGEEGDDT